ncbi:MAG: S1 RNA-binding domain-containing protein, partial [Candidatus Poseidoniaceae archaeon]
NVTFHRRDGTTTTETMVPGLTVRHTQPWDDSGIDGKGTYPIEHVRKVLFGNAAVFDWDGIIIVGPDGTGTEGGDADDPVEKFKVGETYPGTVVHHLVDDGNIHGILVELVARKVTGKIPSKEVERLNPDLIDMFYGIGKTVDVKIVKIDGPKRIQLAIADAL